MNTKARKSSNWTIVGLPDISKTVCFNPFSMIGSEWMLVTAGKPDNWNGLTASWGGLGFLWNKNVAFVFVRHSRYTYSYVEASDTLSLSFLPGNYRHALNWFGANSGRDEDKAKGSGLTPIFFEDETVAFDEASLVLSCTKLYAQDLCAEAMLDKGIITSHYANADYHRMYVAEIKAIRIKAK